MRNRIILYIVVSLAIGAILLLMVRPSPIQSMFAGDVNMIRMSIAEINAKYYWVSSNGLNPELALVKGEENMIKITNPTNDTHKLLMLDKEGDVIAESSKVLPGSSDEFSVMPVEHELEYQCDYHDEMKGKVRTMPG